MSIYSILRDNVVWDEEQEREAKQKTDDQLANKANEELQGTIDETLVL